MHPIEQDRLGFCRTKQSCRARTGILRGAVGTSSATLGPLEDGRSSSPQAVGAQGRYPCSTALALATKASQAS